MWHCDPWHVAERWIKIILVGGGGDDFWWDGVCLNMTYKKIFQHLYIYICIFVSSLTQCQMLRWWGECIFPLPWIQPWCCDVYNACCHNVLHTYFYWVMHGPLYFQIFHSILRMSHSSLNYLHIPRKSKLDLADPSIASGSVSTPGWNILNPVMLPFALLVDNLECRNRQSHLISAS